MKAVGLVESFASVVHGFDKIGIRVHEQVAKLGDGAFPHGGIPHQTAFSRHPVVFGIVGNDALYPRCNHPSVIGPIQYGGSDNNSDIGVRNVALEFGRIFYKIP